jgi:hypothetical protein
LEAKRSGLAAEKAALLELHNDVPFMGKTKEAIHEPRRAIQKAAFVHVGVEKAGEGAARGFSGENFDGTALLDGITAEECTPIHRFVSEALNKFSFVAGIAVVAGDPLSDAMAETIVIPMVVEIVQGAFRDLSLAMAFLAIAHMAQFQEPKLIGGVERGIAQPTAEKVITPCHVGTHMIPRFSDEHPDLLQEIGGANFICIDE